VVRRADLVALSIKTVLEPKSGQFEGSDASSCLSVKQDQAQHPDREHVALTDVDAPQGDVCSVSLSPKVGLGRNEPRESCQPRGEVFVKAVE
jgi:hypothetical protein